MAFLVSVSSVAVCERLLHGLENSEGVLHLPAVHTAVTGVQYDADALHTHLFPYFLSVLPGAAIWW